MSGFALENLGQLLERAAQRYPHKLALIFEGQEWTFASLERASRKISVFLQTKGVVAGDVVSLYSPNCPEWIISYYAVLRVGAVVNPLNLMLTAEEAKYAMLDCGARAVLGEAERVCALTAILETSEIPVRVGFGQPGTSDILSLSDILDGGDPLPSIDSPSIVAESPSTICYTSGTTGHPKGAVLSHHSVLMNAAMTATLHGRTEQDVVVSALPFSHVYGNIVMNAAVGCGMTLVLHRTFNVEEVLSSIQRYRATLFEGVPTMYMYLLNSGRLGSFDVSSLRRCTVGGQTMPEQRMLQLEAALGCPILELWGMTELGGLGTTHSLYGPRRQGSIGVPLPHLEARIVSVEDPSSVVSVGEVGELQIRGSMVMKGYFNNADASAKSIDEAGWLSTGDLARQDKDGYLYVVDRLKDMIITAGFNIYPVEVERVIIDFPSIAMVAVAGVPDEQKGELAKAYIVLHEGATLDHDALEQYCRTRLAAYKIPKLYQVVSTLPMTSSGKIMKRKLIDLI